MKHRMTGCAALFALATIGAVPAFSQVYPENTTSGTTTTVTSVTGTITQLNYDSEGIVGSFLVGTNVLLTFPTNIPAGIASLGAVGNSVTYSGNAFTNSSGFQDLQVTSFTNNTTKATYSSSTTASSTTAYGPTSGAIKQLNYDGSGNVDAFLFTPSGSSTAILVETGSVTNTTLKAALVAGATVSVTGTTHTATATSCTVSGALTVVDASSLIISGTTYVLTGVGQGNPGRGGRH
jgi:type VI secretion system secreted protein VgrG